MKALTMTLITFPDLVAHMEATRQPLRDDEMRRAVINGVSAHAGSVVQQLKARTILLTAAAMVAAVVAVGAGGFWYGRTAEAEKYLALPAALGVALNGPQGDQWLQLMRLNNITAAYRTCATLANGDACSFALWITPPKPASPLPDNAQGK